MNTVREDGFFDVYVLAPERSDAIVRRFESRWLTGLEEAAEDYPFPMFDDSPVAVYRTASDVIDRLLLEPDQEYSIYWTGGYWDLRGDWAVPGGALHSAHLFFTGDGGLIVGITIGAERYAETAATLDELAASVGGAHGYATGEEPPPFETTAEFIARARSETGIKLLPD